MHLPIQFLKIAPRTRSPMYVRVRKPFVKRKWFSGESECRVSWADWLDCVCVHPRVCVCFVFDRCLTFLECPLTSPSPQTLILHLHPPSSLSLLPQQTDGQRASNILLVNTHTHLRGTSDPFLTQPWPRLECNGSFDTHSRKQTHDSLCPNGVLRNKGKYKNIEVNIRFQGFQDL